MAYQTKNKKVQEELMQRAEALQKLIKKAEAGTQLSNEDIRLVVSIKAEQVLGMTEEERLRSKFQIISLRISEI